MYAILVCLFVLSIYGHNNGNAKGILTESDRFSFQEMVIFCLLKMPTCTKKLAV